MGSVEMAFLTGCMAVFLLCSAPEVFSSDEKPSSIISPLLSESTLRSRFLDSNPCSQYRDVSSLPQGHPCQGIFHDSEDMLIPRLVGELKRNNPNAGKHPGGPKNHPGGPKRHPGGPKRRPGGPKRHPRSKGRRPPRIGPGGIELVRCRARSQICQDTARNGYLKYDSTAKTCCRSVCVSLFNDSGNCGACSVRCRRTGNKCCGGVCKDVRTDADNCGRCGNVCDSKLSCVAGICGQPY